MKSTLLAAAFSVLAFLSTAFSATTWYVDGAMPSSGDGKSWGAALKTIQEGINAASNGDTVVVATGTYLENIHFNGKNIVLQSTDPLDPNVVARTIIDAEQTGPVVRFDGTEGESCVLSGFTVRNGLSDNGGGICGGTQPQPTHATVRNNVVSGNQAIGEWPNGHGGGLFCCYGLVEDNAVVGNSAGHAGGGVERCNGIVRKNLLSDNFAAVRGGGAAYCDGMLLGNTIRGNVAGDSGGGVDACHGVLRSNLIAGNTANVKGGGLHACHGAVENNTISRNHAPSGGGLFGCHGTVTNCVVWANTGFVDAQLSDSSSPHYSCIQNWAEGATGNITDDPMLADDYSLREDSPCIDRGCNDEWMWESADVKGSPRVFPGRDSWRVDMGAYEHIPLSYGLSFHVVKTQEGIHVVWTSQLAVVYGVQSCLDLSHGDWSEEAVVDCQGAATFWVDTSPLPRRKFYRLDVE